MRTGKNFNILCNFVLPVLVKAPNDPKVIMVKSDPPEEGAYQI